MRPIAPRTGEPEVTVAEEQHEYRPIVAAIRRRRLEDMPGVELVAHVTRWTLTHEERRRIAAGEDVYVEQLTGGGPMQPISVTVGPEL